MFILLIPAQVNWDKPTGILCYMRQNPSWVQKSAVFALLFSPYKKKFESKSK